MQPSALYNLFANVTHPPARWTFNNKHNKLIDCLRSFIRRRSDIVRTKTDRFTSMEALSHTVGPTVAPLRPKRPLRWNWNGFSSVLVQSKKNHPSGICRSAADEVSQSARASGLDFNDPDWKSKFQSDFEKRFSLPHITDIFRDATPIPSTFCLRMRSV